MIIERVPEAWVEFQAQVGGLSRPMNEQEYERIVSLMHLVAHNYDTASEPYATLFDYLAKLAHDWEVAYEPDLKSVEVAPRAVLAYLLQEHGVSQYQLAQEGIVNQGNLSRILSGERGISRELAKRLAVRFGVSADTFL
ncbi:MAG: helix-turn-helix domain-containing protein [Trueperaceae bacterium]|nr:helix-turn-helix domain-containing protein [Trueperaceae bacterium]